MTTYSVPVRVVFEGEVTVECDDLFEAEQIAQGLSATIGEVGDGGYKQIVDWRIDATQTEIETEEPTEGEEQ